MVSNNTLPVIAETNENASYEENTNLDLYIYKA